MIFLGMVNTFSIADGRTRSRLSVGTAGQRAIGSLPPEILCCIFKLLHLSDKVAAERVSKVWLRELQRSQVCPYCITT